MSSLVEALLCIPVLALWFGPGAVIVAAFVRVALSALGRRTSSDTATRWAPHVARLRRV